MRDYSTTEYILSTCTKPSQNTSQGRSKQLQTILFASYIITCPAIIKAVLHTNICLAIIKAILLLLWYIFALILWFW